MTSGRVTWAFAGKVPARRISAKKNMNAGRSCGNFARNVVKFFPDGWILEEFCGEMRWGRDTCSFIHLRVYFSYFLFFIDNQFVTLFFLTL